MNIDQSDLGASRYGCRFMFDVSAGVTDVDAHDERTDR